MEWSGVLTVICFKGGRNSGGLRIRGEGKRVTTAMGVEGGGTVRGSLCVEDENVFSHLLR